MAASERESTRANQPRAQNGANAPAKLKQLDEWCIARSSSEAAVAGEQRSTEFFGKYEISCIVSGKVVTAPPDLRQQDEMGIARNPEVLEIEHCLLGAARRNRSFPRQSPEDLGNLNIQEVRSMQGFVARIDALFDALSGRCLEKPIYRGGRIENNHRAFRASRSCRTMRAVPSSAETGLRLCKRSRNSKSVGRSAISLISARR